MGIHIGELKLKKFNAGDIIKVSTKDDPIIGIYNGIENGQVHIKDIVTKEINSIELDRVIDVA